MKNSLNIILLSLALLAGIRLHAQATNLNDRNACLELDGRILNADKKCRIEIRRLSATPDTFIINGDRKKFRVFLDKNNFYTLRIAREGYADKIVLIDTNLPGELDDLYKFSFDTQLVKLQDGGAGGNLSAGLPDAFISFNRTRSCFEYNREQTRRVRSELLSRAF